MTEQMYLVIDSSEDGLTIAQVDREALQRMITPGEDGYIELDASRAMASVPRFRDSSEWGDLCLIIRGEIVTPRKKEVVTVYELE